jgi:hypothetical protein
VESLRELFLKLGLDADETKFASAQLAVNGLQKALELVVDAAQAVGDFFVSAIADTEAYGSKINDLSARSGIATDALQGFGYAAELSGSSVEEATHALEILGRGMSAAKAGSAEAQAGFTKLGLRVTDASGNLRDTTEVMYEAADALLKLPEGAERTTAAYAVFGRGAKGLGALLAEGGAGMREMVERGKSLDLVMSGDMVKAADTFGDSLGTVHRVVARFSQYIGETLMPVLQPMLDGFLEWWKLNHALVRLRVERALEPVVKVMTAMGKAVLWLVDNFENLVTVVKTVALIIGSYFVAQLLMAIGGLLTMSGTIASTVGWFIALGVQAAIAGAKAAGSWLAATWPLIALIAGLALLYLVIDDINVTLKGGDSILSRYGEKWAKFISDWSKPDEDDWWITKQLKNAWWWLTRLDMLWEKLMGRSGSSDFGSSVAGYAKPGETGQQIADRTGQQYLDVNTRQVFSPASATPQGTAEASFAGANYSIGPTQTQSVNVGGIIINPHPHQSPEEIGKHVRAEFDRRLSEALPVAGGTP